jgi:hypothetical protein
MNTVFEGVGGENRKEESKIFGQTGERPSKCIKIGT